MLKILPKGFFMQPYTQSLTSPIAHYHDAKISCGLVALGVGSIVAHTALSIFSKNYNIPLYIVVSSIIAVPIYMMNESNGRTNYNLMERHQKISHDFTTFSATKIALCAVLVGFLFKNIVSPLIVNTKHDLLKLSCIQTAAFIVAATFLIKDEAENNKRIRAREEMH